MPFKDLDKQRLAVRRSSLARRKKAYVWMNTLKEERACMDCNRFYPACVMDWDHRNPNEKLFQVAAGGINRNRASLAAEMAKCDLVCANCHRIRTHVTRKAA